MSFLNDLFGTVSTDQQQGLMNQYTKPIDPNNYQISGLQGYLGNISGLGQQYAQLGSQQATQQAGAQEQGVFNQLGGIANGTTPGVGQQLLQQGLNQSMDQQTAQALSNQGSSNPALARRQTASAGAQLSGQAGSNAAVQGAQQQFQALGQQAQLAQQMRSQDFQQQFSALQSQQSALDDSLKANETQTGFNVQQQQAQTAFQQWQYQQAYANAQQQAQGISSLFKGVLGAGTAIASGGMSLALGGGE